MTQGATTWKCWRDASHTDIRTTLYGWPECRQCGAAPAYHERAEFADDITLVIYVPADIDSPFMGIKAGSAIVGHQALDRVDTCWEGWIYGQYDHLDSLGRWEMGLLHAADRLITRYPTVSGGILPVDRLLPVGTYQPKADRKIDIHDWDHLNEWLNKERA